MDPDLVITIAAIPFYGISVVVVAYLAAFAFHTAKTLNDSAAEQAITEQPAAAAAEVIVEQGPCRGFEPEHG